jgi:sugar phosphate isomerase/epimerase
MGRHCNPTFGCILDCGWAMNQREYPPVAIYKLHKHLMSAHMRDIDPAMQEYLPIGQGAMDFQAIADAVKAIGFTGFLSLQQDGSKDDMKETCPAILEPVETITSPDARTTGTLYWLVAARFRASRLNRDQFG